MAGLGSQEQVRLNIWLHERIFPHNALVELCPWSIPVRELARKVEK